MRHQVTAADYRLCVADKGCAPAADAQGDPNLPAITVSVATMIRRAGISQLFTHLCFTFT